jgi:hypothetical protein
VGNSSRKVLHEEQSDMVWKIVSMVEKITMPNADRGELKLSAFIKSEQRNQLTFRKGMELVSAFANATKS